MRRDLKSEREVRFLRLAGSEFQTLGTEEEKERESVDLREVEGTMRNLSEEERRVRDG